MLNEFLLNLLFILVGIFLQHLWSEKTGHHQNKIVIGIASAITITLCIPFPLESSFVEDLKLIPYIIGGLYGGIVTSTILFIIIVVVFTFFYGVTDTYITFLIMYGVLGLVCGFMSPTFLNSNISKKLETMVYVTIVFTIFLFVFTNREEIITIHTIMMLFSPTIAIFVVGYIFESIRETISLRQKIIKTEKSEVVSQLAASVSHEVRNPLTVTRGFLQLVLESDTIEKEKRDEYIKLAIDELDTASNIINDYLTFAKPAPAYWELLDIGIHLKHIEDIISSYANMNSVVIESDLVTCVIQGNKQQFQQCFLNITKNCIEAMPDGGTLNIYTSILNKHVLIEISDTGIGMSQEQINRIGEPYFSTKEKGTGLGMMVVFSIIKGMKGSISIESKQGVGTKFTIKFPIAVPR